MKNNEFRNLLNNEYEKITPDNFDSLMHRNVVVDLHPTDLEVEGDSVAAKSNSKTNIKLILIVCACTVLGFIIVLLLLFSSLNKNAFNSFSYLDVKINPEVNMVFNNSDLTLESVNPINEDAAVVVKSIQEKYGISNFKGENVVEITELLAKESYDLKYLKKQEILLNIYSKDEKTSHKLSGLIMNKIKNNISLDNKINVSYKDVKEVTFNQNKLQFNINDLLQYANSKNFYNIENNQKTKQEVEKLIGDQIQESKDLITNKIENKTGLLAIILDVFTDFEKSEIADEIYSICKLQNNINIYLSRLSKLEALKLRNKMLKFIENNKDKNEEFKRNGVKKLIKEAIVDKYVFVDETVNIFPLNDIDALGNSIILKDSKYKSLKDNILVDDEDTIDNIVFVYFYLKFSDIKNMVSEDYTLKSVRARNLIDNMKDDELSIKFRNFERNKRLFKELKNKETTKSVNEIYISFRLGLRMLFAR